MTVEHPHRSRKKRIWMILPVAGALTGLLLALVLNFTVRERQRARLAEKRNASPSELSGSRLADSLLTDSILSIIQSYYVDPERVDNRGLLATVLASLATDPRVRTGTSPGSVWVEVDGERRIFPIKEKPRYQDVLEIFAVLSRLVEAKGVTLPLGESSERRVPASVALLNSVLAELDAHSALLSPDAYKELRQGTEGAFGGLGVLVGIRNNLLTVIKPLPRSPAHRAGIRRHDRILGIDGLFTYGYSLDELVEYMRGDPGTDVKLSLLREGASAPSELTLKREVIHVDSVAVEELDRRGLNVLHLTVENFASRTSREVLSAIKKFRAKHGGVMHGLILDLRANPGGLLDQAVQVADLFLQDGVIVTTKGRREEVESADTGFDEVGFPVAVLIDGDSASASEIVAGALQDHGRALVIGQPSFGKGSVQTIFELPGERALKLTIARYYTPAGRSIQNVGIIPDIWLQPVAQSDLNENLFGSYRYKNERFLRNHLETDQGMTQGAVYQPARKAYYLGKPVDVEDVGAERIEDHELDLALDIFDKIRATYGNALPPGTGRASHWLGLAGPKVGEELQRMDGGLANWLRDKHGVEWRRSAQTEADPSIELKVVDGESLEVTAGADLTVPWSLHNREDHPIGRVSLFIRSDAAGFETKEVLVGEIGVGATRTGSITLPIPSHFDPGSLPLRIGVAVDAWPAPHGAVDFVVQVKDRPVAVLTASAVLADEVGGELPLVLEGREKAKVRIVITNSSAVDARKVRVNLVNLAGRQIELSETDVELERIAPGDSATVTVSIVGGRMIFTPEIGLGLLVESQDLKLPVRQRFAVRGRPNGELSAKGVGPTSH